MAVIVGALNRFWLTSCNPVVISNSLLIITKVLTFLTFVVVLFIFCAQCTEKYD